MSTERLAFGNVNEPNILLPPSDYYKLALLVLEEMMNTCKFIIQFQNTIDIMRGQHYHNVASNGQQHNVSCQTYMFGKMIPNKRQFFDVNFFMKYSAI